MTAYNHKPYAGCDGMPCAAYCACTQVQLLLFSATFNEHIKRFAMQIAPRANHLFVAKEELSLDVIAQYNVRCGAAPVVVLGL